MDGSVLNSRSQAILRQAVHLFISGGEPVGSRTLSKVNIHGLSPATIRNIMSELEEIGYLYQPHTSAGRVPTDLGYRFYVSTVAEDTSLSQAEQQMVEEYFRSTEGGVSELMQRTTRLLSDMTDTVSFVIGPNFENSVLKHVDFVLLARRRLLVVLVSQTGQVLHRIVTLDEDLRGEELAQCARYLEGEFNGVTLVEARELILQRMRAIEVIVNRLVKNALVIADAAFAGEIQTSEVHLDGASRMLSKPEFKMNIERARHLLETLEKRHHLINLLNACLQGARLQIVIGSESQVPDLEGISLIGARYTDGDQDLGSIGIMGPTRMEYARFISIVDYIASSLSEAIRVGKEMSN